MRATISAILLVAVLATPLVGKKKVFPRVIATARYVFITDARGSQFTSEMTQEDRAAVARVRRAIRVWDRYTDVESADQADIILVVRAGRRAGTHNGGVIIPPMPGSDRGIQIGTTGGVDVGSTIDTLAIYRNDVNGAPLWQSARDHGLEGSDPPLVQDLREQVEQSDADEKQKKP